MIGVGRVALWLVVAAAVVVAARPRRAGAGLAVSLAAGLAAVGALSGLLATGDWSVAYVVDHSRAGIPLPLRLAGLWAGPEGSFLLWSTLVSAAVVAAHRLAPAPVRPAVARRGAIVVAAHGVVQVAALDPFTGLAVPAVTGLGLQPVLEHPAMVWHPPLLYAGLVGLLAPALLVAGSRPVPWPTVRTVLGVSLGLLTAGLATGGRWAYAELGWGGYWGWDPIENGALVAWAAGLSALHWPVPRFPRAAIALTVAPVVTVIWVAVLTRTGLVSSVHAFSEQPGLVAWSTALAATVTAVVVTGAAGASGELGGPGSSGRAVPVRARARVWGSAVLVVAAVLVALGVVAPVIQAQVTGDEVVIAGRYFARALFPVTLAGAAALVLFGRCRWLAAGAGALVAAALVGAAGGTLAGVALGAAAGAVATESIVSVVRRPAAWRAGLGHLGVAVLVLGVAGTTGRQDAMGTVAAGERIEIAGVSVTHRSVVMEEEGDRRVGRATAEVDGRPVHPAIVSHLLRRVRTNEFAHLLRPQDEVQVALVDGDDRAATYRVIRHPLLPLVWSGAALMVAAALVPPRRARRTSPVEAGPAEPIPAR